MKKPILWLVLVLLTSCNSQSKQNNIVQHSCDCIKNIPLEKEQSEIINQLQICVSTSYEVYAEFVDDLATKYMEKNEDAELVDAQNWIREWLSGKLVEHCPSYSKIVSSISFENRNTSDLIKNIANEVCNELNALKAQELSWNEVDPIFIKMLNKHQSAINAKYDLSKKDAVTTYSTDLVQELVVSCERYKRFTVQINK